MSKPVRVALMGGWFYPISETPWGMPALKTRLEAIGATVLLVSWDARQQVYDFMQDRGFSGLRFYAGDSLGAGSAGQYPGDVSGTVDYAAGFQPSNYDARSMSGVQTIAANITFAHCFYDPSWIDTFGLGNTYWRKAPNSATKLLLTQHSGAHPDDWGFTQNVCFQEMKGIIDAS